MLRICIEGEEFYNEAASEFVQTSDVFVDLEHSLVSVSKWEAEIKKPFLVPGKKTVEEIIAYLKMMVITSGIDPDILSRCSEKNFEEIQAYIDDSQTATTIHLPPEKGRSREVITSELIYYWMITFNIPFECQYWHLNRLLTLIRICNVKNSKPRTMSRHEQALTYAQLNAERRAKYGTKG